MLDAKIVTRIREYVAAELEPRGSSIDLAIRGIQNGLAARGLMGSSAAVHMIGLAGADELAVRAEVIWRAIRRSYVSLASGVTTTTLDDLIELFNGYLAAEERLLSDVVAKPLGRFARMGTDLTTAVRTRARELQARYRVEIQFFVDDLNRPPAAAGAPTFTFNAPVGAVQMGAHSIAHVLQSHDDRQRLASALGEFRQAVQENSEVTAQGREQALELIDDALTTLRTTKPSGPKIAGLLVGLATGIQTVGSLRSAWEIVRGIAIALGLPVP